MHTQESFTVRDAIKERLESTRAAIIALQNREHELTEALTEQSNRKGIKQWFGFEFESSSGLTPEFAAFARGFKKHLKSIIPQGSELVEFNCGHFYISGFIKRDARFVYFSLSDVRRSAWQDSILVRTAKHEKDYTGGTNNQIKLENFTENVERMLNSIGE